VASVLLGEHGGGHQHGDLFAVLAGLEGGADGDLGFAKAHVAADQPVHGVVVGHVGLDRGDGGGLVVGFVEGEGVFKLALPLGVGGVADAGLGGAGGLHPQQLSGEVFDRVGDLVFLPLPLAAAELGQRGAALEAADVFLDQVDLRGGHVELDLIGKLQGEVFAAAAGRAVGLLARPHGLEAGELGDAVVHA